MAFANFSNKQIGIKTESVNGTPETLDVTNYGLECTDITASSAIENIEKNVFRASISSSPNRIGKITATAEIGGELKNSGTINIDPKIADVLISSRMVPTVVNSLSMSSVSGSFVRGSTVITGATSNAKGVIMGVEAGKVYYTYTSGTFVNETISGAGGFLGAVSGVDVPAVGKVYRPSSTEASEKTVTMSILDGGLKKDMYGCASTFTMELSTESYPKYTASYTGIADPATWGTKGTAVAGVVYESHNPPIVTNAVLRIGSTYAPVTSMVSIDLGNTVTMIDNLNSDTWLEYAVVTQRNATGSITILANLDESGDLYSKLFAGDTASLEFQIGDGAGNQIDVLCPAIQYTGISEADDEGFLGQTLELKVTGIDNELQLWFR